MDDPVIDRELLAIARIQQVLEEYCNIERWRILEYLEKRYSAPSSGTLLEAARRQVNAVE
jgi:hypothetical protein